MIIHHPERVASIRARVQAQMALISEIESKIGTGELDVLSIARDQTEDVEGVFLASIGRERRTPEEEASWLDAAERMLGVWSPRLAKLASSSAGSGRDRRR